MRVTLDTRVHFVFDAYRVVLCLDLAPSLHALDTSTGVLLFDHLFRSVAVALTSLTLPLRLPNNPAVAASQLCVSVIALDSTDCAPPSPIELSRAPKLRLLLPETLVSHTNVCDVLRDLRNALLHIENLQVARAQRHSASQSAGTGPSLAAVTPTLGPVQSASTGAKSKLTSAKSLPLPSALPVSSKVGGASTQTAAAPSSTGGGRAGDLRTLLQAGLFSLSHMDRRAHPLLMLATTGDLQVSGAEGTAVIDSVLMQCARADVRVTVLHSAGAAASTGGSVDSANFHSNAFALRSPPLATLSDMLSSAGVVQSDALPSRSLGSVSDIGTIVRCSVHDSHAHF